MGRKRVKGRFEFSVRFKVTFPHREAAADY
jgi:hypothetical protein